VSDRRVLVVGTGTMAPGIAATFALAGSSVVVCGRSSDRTAECIARAHAMMAFCEEEGIAPGTSGLNRGTIEASTDLRSAAGGCDVAVESVSEDLAVKRAVFSTLEDSAHALALLATNTSGLRITDIAEELRHPERVVALHFWNPAHLMPIVEVAGGQKTSADTVERASRLTESIGKLPVVLRTEVLGFLGTRMQQAVVREAVALLDAGVASAKDIDRAVTTSFGIRFPITGPLESADISGLDVIAAIHSYLLPELNVSASPQRGLRERVGRGDLGVKAGRGFFDWSARDPEERIAKRDRELVRQLRRMRSEGDLPSVRGSGREEKRDA
jgi:3-hydroxybutyryl-CoA dehydrogenase